MNSYVMDTNVLIVANDKYENANFEEVHVCQNFLNDIKVNRKKISIDSQGLIINEYFNHASLSGQPGLGDAFIKWLYRNQFDPTLCEQVEITEDESKGFKEFPSDKNLEKFDKSDRKFVAVALNSKYDAIICNATDSDWWQYKDHLKKAGVIIEFLCPRLIKKNENRTKSKKNR